MTRRPHSSGLPQRLCTLLVFSLGGLLGSSCAGGSTGSTSTTLAAKGPIGEVIAPGGPFLFDATGRVVILHGVNLVYKVPPYEVVTAGKGINVLTDREAAAIAADGFDVVRLGIIWKGLEPGTAPMNDPSICSPGAPGTAGKKQFDPRIFDAYMSRLVKTVHLLARHGIYSLVDMHQDALNEAFAGEGFPNWAVCTDGIVPVAKRNVPDWGVNNLDPGMLQATEHFWTNDVVGDLQGAYDDIWAKVARYLRNEPYVIGYDPFNEPYELQAVLPPGNNAGFDAELQCFYGGRGDPGLDQSGAPIRSCPPDDPKRGLIASIEAADPRHAVFYEPDISTNSGISNQIGPMDFPRLVLNFHDYCFLHVPNGPEPPDFSKVCPSLEKLVVSEREKERINDRSAAQPNGPGWFMSEFGATTDTADLARVVGDADASLVGWTYWQWLRYDDPTGSHASGLWPPGPATSAQLAVLSEPYAEAVAGTPTSMSYDAAGDIFRLVFTPDQRIKAPTVVFVPVARHYSHGYCARVLGGRVTSRPGASHLTIASAVGSRQVTVTVTPGHC